MDKAIAEQIRENSQKQPEAGGTPPNLTKLVKKLAYINQLRGIEAMRISYLYDGDSKEADVIPQLSMFVQTYYKKYDELIPHIPIEDLR